MKTIQPPLNNLQLELLKIYAQGISNDELTDIRQLLFDYFAKRSVKAADAIWQENGWTDEDAHRLLHKHQRRSAQ
jgi:hypothetical protein